ncbi:sulfite exporter TauE/SafE family protein [Noviherbaspirillum sp. ST9]|uniref:sulfite exporter TauE/SafE family protein n=1 Tax=Noviherbaspirillum sp. ST9 TaxID=3401606 RepID=UPI003B58812F
MLPSLLSGVPAFLALVAAGYALGIVGNVGGPLFVLILLTVDHLPTTTAIGTAMFVSCLISLFAFVGHWRRKNVVMDYGLITGFAGAIGCFLGALFAQRVPVRVLEPLLGVVVLIIPTIGLVRLAKRVRPSPARDVAGPAPMIGTAFFKAAGGGMGMVVGFFCGAFGLGGATPIAALSRMLLQQPMRFCIGSAYLAALCISLVGTAFYAVNGQIELRYAALLSIGCGLGVYLSTRAVSRIPDRILEALMLTTMVAMAIFTLFDSWKAL